MPEQPIPTDAVEPSDDILKPNEGFQPLSPDTRLSPGAIVRPKVCFDLVVTPPGPTESFWERQEQIFDSVNQAKIDEMQKKLHEELGEGKVRVLEGHRGTDPDTPPSQCFFLEWHTIEITGRGVTVDQLESAVTKPDPDGFAPSQVQAMETVRVKSGTDNTKLAIAGVVVLGAAALAYQKSGR